jgi:uncharacterized protein (TIGR04255 family)
MLYFALARPRAEEWRDVGAGDAGNPPVNEVVLSFAYEQTPSNTIGPRLLELLGDRYPSDAQIESAPPYLPLPELFPAQPTISPEMLLGTQEFPEPRYWVHSRSAPEFLVQVQQGYLALNWRQRDRGTAYVHYPALRQEFVDRIGGIHRRLGSPTISRAEMSYINILDYPAGRVPSDLFPSFAPPGDKIDGYTWGYSREFGEPGSPRHGRVRASVASGWQSKDLRHIVNLTLSAKSPEIVSGNFDDALIFMDAAHDVLNEEFRAVASPQALEMWGIS